MEEVATVGIFLSGVVLGFGIAFSILSITIFVWKEKGSEEKRGDEE